EIFCGFGVVEEVELAGVFGAETAADGFADGAPDLWRGDHLDAGELSERGNFANGGVQSARTTHDLVKSGGGFNIYAFCFHAASHLNVAHGGYTRMSHGLSKVVEYRLKPACGKQAFAILRP